jgi:tetratricopeptide (TPR) repeat protein
MLQSQACLGVARFARIFVRLGYLARRFGRVQEAERLLRCAAALAPEDAAIRRELIAFLQRSFRLIEAERLAAEAVAAAPGDVESGIRLAEIQYGLGRFKEAVQTLESLLAVAPEDAQIWLEYGRVARYCYESLRGEEELFTKAAELAANDAVVIKTVAEYYLFQQQFDRAADLYARLFAADPRTWDNPVACRNYAESLNGRGQRGSASDVIARGLARCRTAAATSKGESRELLMREEARLLNEAVRPDAATAVLKRIKAAGVTNFARPEYLPGSPERLARLRRLVEGRDALLLLQGPSLADFAAQAKRVAGLDFVAATLGHFPPVDETLFNCAGRHVELVVLSHPTVLQAWHADLVSFLDRPGRGMLLTSRYALSGLGELGVDQAGFLRRYDDRLLIVEPAGGPPLPSRPLHFEHGGSLALTLPLLLLGRPRRIFVFGADGGASPESAKAKRPYYYYEDVDSDAPPRDFERRPGMVTYKGLPDRLATVNERFRIDAINNDRVMRFAVQCQEAIFEVPTPPIYNACPHSTHQLFPRITCSEAMSMLSEEPANLSRRSHETEAE